MLLKFMPGRAWFPVYEGEEETQKTETENKETETKTEEEVPDSAKGKTTFTQDEFNKALAEDRRKHKGQVEKTVKELEEFKKSRTLTEKEKSNLQDRIDELQKTLLTKEQLAAKDKEKLEKTHKSTVESLTTERNTWQNRFVRSQINQAITSEAATAEAFDVEDLIARLGPNTRLDEDKDDAGTALDSFTAKVKYNDVDNEGKPITLDLTVEQAVKRMKDTPKFAHLFKSTASGGIGANNGAGKGQKLDISKMTPEQYREHSRKQGLRKKGFGEK